MSRFDEMRLREQFENDRLKLLASRLLRLSGCRSMVIAYDDNDDVDIWCSTGHLVPSDDFIGDALVDDDASDEKPLHELTGRK